MASTTSAGIDKVYTGTSGESDDTEDSEKNLPSSLTLLVNMKQAEILAGLDSKKSFHTALVYRGSREQAEKFLAEQDKYFTEANGVESNAK
ncbi:MAG TPA: hypothetical protein DEP23_16515 [Ruminococcaceae bacterium]|nr:hypothetical protein [Oscillospiraceae bacterium]